MNAVFKREFKSYFNTPIGFIFLAAFYFFLALCFVAVYASGSPQLELAVMAMSIIAVFTLPILTMKLMSEDRRLKVDQALLTAPVKLTSIVLGKFFAAFSVYALGYAPTVIFEIIIASKIQVNVLSYIYSLLGMLLLGGALISIGMFISCLTESPVVSAILTLVINIVIIYMSSFSSAIGITWIQNILDKLAFISAVDNFGQSIICLSDIVYFLSIIAIFIFLSVRSLEKRRWA